MRLLLSNHAPYCNSTCVPGEIVIRQNAGLHTLVYNVWQGATRLSPAISG